MLKSCSFIKVNCNVESKTISMNFFLNSVSLKPLGLSANLKGSLPMHDFVPLCIGHLKNTGLLSYTDLSDVNISLYNIQDSHLLISPFMRKIIIEKLSNSW